MIELKTSILLAIWRSINIRWIGLNLLNLLLNFLIIISLFYLCLLKHLLNLNDGFTLKVFDKFSLLFCLPLIQLVLDIFNFLNVCLLYFKLHFHFSQFTLFYCLKVKRKLGLTIIYLAFLDRRKSYQAI